MNTYFFVLTAALGHGVERRERTVTGELVAGPDDTQASLYAEAVATWGAHVAPAGLDASFVVSYYTVTKNELPWA